MSARSRLEVWQQLERRVRRRIADGKLRHARFRKLQGKEAKKAVIDGTVARLMAPDAPFPYALRKRLAPRPLVVRGAPAGWLYWRPVDPLQWAAWLTVHERHIEHGEFWFEKSAAADELIDKAIDAERRAYCSATSDSGGTADGKPDPEALESLSRHTEAGQALTDEPSRLVDQQKQEMLEEAALAARERLDAAENAKLQQAIQEYGRKLKCKKQRKALSLIFCGQKSRGCDIALKCRISESTVSKLRAKVEKLADQILTIPPEENAPTDVAQAPEMARDETLTQIAEAVDSSALDLAATFQAPDVDAEMLESALHGYAKHKSTSAYMRDNWSGGRRRFSDAELVTGSRYGGWADDPAKIAEHATRHASKFSEVEMRELQQKAVAADFAINGFLRAIESFLSKRAAESVDGMLGPTIAPKNCSAGRASGIGAAPFRPRIRQL